MSRSSSHSGRQSWSSGNRHQQRVLTFLFLLLVGAWNASCSKTASADNDPAAVSSEKKAPKGDASAKGIYPELAPYLHQLSKGLGSENDKLKAEAVTQLSAYVAALQPVRYRFTATFKRAKQGEVTIKWNNHLLLPEESPLAIDRWIQFSGEGVKEDGLLHECLYSTKAQSPVWENLSLHDPITVEATVQFKMTDYSRDYDNTARWTSRADQKFIEVVLSNVTLSKVEK